MKNISIKDVAKIAKVSPSTVSKALNNHSDIKEETKKRIKKIAKELNYTPSAFGKGLKKQSTGNIGVIFNKTQLPLSGNTFYSRVLEGIEGEIAMFNHNLVLQLMPEDNPTDLPKMVRETSVDGIILVGVFLEDFVDRINDLGIPYVLIDPIKLMKNTCHVLIDNNYGIRTAMDYLIKQGHKDIAFICSDLNRLSFRQRYDGYLQTMKKYGLDIKEEWIVTGGVIDGYKQVVKILNQKNRPSAILSANDLNAIYGYQAILDTGLKIPDDISIMGFDDIEQSKYMNPKLTTIRVYKEEMGSVAVRMLFDLIKKVSIIPINKMIPIKLVERGSVKKVEDK